MSFVTVRKYSGCTDVPRANREAQTTLRAVLEKSPGFRSYTIIASGGDTLTSIGIFETRAAAEAANATARDVVGRVLGKDIMPNPPEIIMGEVTDANWRG